MKEFFDRCYYPVLGQLEGRPYAQMVCAGSDGENAARQTARIATGWRLKEVHPALIVCTHAQTKRKFWRRKPFQKQTWIDAGHLERRLLRAFLWACFRAHLITFFRPQDHQVTGCYIACQLWITMSFSRH